MAGSLWISKSGTRRKGTTFREIQGLFINQITTKHIYEPLYSTDLGSEPLEVLRDLNYYDFDVVGVINEKKEVVGYIRKNQLSEGPLSDLVNRFDLASIVTDSTPISNLIQLLANKDYVFVMHGNSIDGIVTLADINKPIVRLYLFSIISLFEMHLNYWITHHHSNNSWKELINDGRIAQAETIFSERQGANSALSLLDCLQFCDKRDILFDTKKYMEEFQFSKSKFKTLVSNVEKIRNELAHSQSKINANLAWPDFVSTIALLERSLSESEQKVEIIVSDSLKD